MSAPMSPAAPALFALASELSTFSDVRAELIYHARRLEHGMASESYTAESLDGYAQVSEDAWTPDERAAFALAREALALVAGVEGGAK